MTIGENSKVDLKVLAWIVSAAVAWGALYQQVQALRETVVPIPQMERDLASIKAILTRGGSLSQQ